MKYTAKWNVLFNKPEKWLCFTPKEGTETYPCYACQTLYVTSTIPKPNSCNDSLLYL